MPSPSPRPRPRRPLNSLAFPALLALVAWAPAGAVVGPAGGDAAQTARWEAAAHLDGARFPWIVSIEADHGDGVNVSSCTGVFLGCGAPGRGFVLTAAHGVREGQPGPLGKPGPPVQITFGPWMDAPSAIRIPATRVVLHPEFKALPGSPDLSFFGQVTANDLAILEFDPRPWTEALARAGVRPIEVFDGEVPAGPVDAVLAGFGLRGAVGQGPARFTGRVHAGATRVTQTRTPAGQGFHHWTLARAEGEADALDHHNQYLHFTQTTRFQPGGARPPVLFASHPDQAYLAPGDSGGPLLLLDRGTWKLAGIATAEYREELPAVPSGPRLLLVAQHWEPVMAHLDWIRKVLAEPVPDRDQPMAEADPAQAACRKRKAPEAPEPDPASPAVKRPVPEDRGPAAAAADPEPGFALAQEVEPMPECLPFPEEPEVLLDLGAADASPWAEQGLVLAFPESFEGDPGADFFLEFPALEFPALEELPG